jgi:hypothetical protein
MKLKITILMLSAMLAAPAAYCTAPAQGYRPAMAAGEVICTSEDMQLFYYYLAPEPGQQLKERPTKCHGAKATLKMPAWLEKDLPAMQERKVWTDPDEGKLSEAQLWQTAVSILYEFADNTRKMLPIAEGGASVPAAEMEERYNEVRQRFIMSVDRITRANLEGSFSGRGTALLATMNGVIERMDGLTGALAKEDTEAFNKNVTGALKLSRELFSQLFEGPRSGSGEKFKPKYTPEARVLPGYRGVSLKVSGSQAMFLKSGERADMLVTFDAIMNSGNKEKVTATILQNVVVVKVFKPASPSDSGVVQLLCNPVEAQYAALSLSQGSSITLVRRAEGDVELRPMEIASFRKLIK